MIKAADLALQRNTLRVGRAEPTFPFQRRAVLLVAFQHFSGQTLPRMDGREEQLVFLIIALHHLQYLDGKGA